MKNMMRNRSFYILVALLLLCSLSSAAQAIRTKAQLNTILTLLPSDTQSIVVASGPFKLTPLPSIEKQAESLSLMSKHFESWWQYAPAPKQQIRWICTLPENFEHIGDGKLYKLMTERTITTSVKAFFPVHQKNQESACNLVELQDSDKLHREFEKTAKNLATSEHYYLDYTVFEFQLSNPRSPEGFIFPKIFVCLPCPGLIVSASDNENVLHQVLARLHAKSRRDALHAGLSEWHYVNSESEVFGIRHFGLAEDDKTSPLVKRTGSPSAIDPDAIGCVLNLTDAKLEFIYLSKSKDLQNVVSRLFPKDDLRGDISSTKFASISPESVKITIDTTDKEASFWTSALHWLGNRASAL